MNYTNAVINQQYLAQEENNQTSFFGRNFILLGFPIPFWLISLCCIILILCLIFGMSDTTTYTEVYPSYEFSVVSDSPTNTVVDNILRRNY